LSQNEQDHITHAHTRDRREEYAQWLREEFGAEVEIHHNDLSDPMNFQGIYEKVVAVLDSVRARNGAEARFVYHISPGTSAMAAIWIILAKTAYSAELIQSSVEGGVKVISVPFDISADFTPAVAISSDDDILRISHGLPPQSPEFDEITHSCAAMKNAITKSRLVALHDIPVLIQGESGTGKELFARAIHGTSSRMKGPFVEVNCGAIPEQLFESELFGHEKGAFTGAERMKKGYAESADGGTLFLDEIGELPLYAQVKLLRMLQERSVVRVGSTRAIKVDIRIIAATNKNLAAEVAKGNFREDLFHRLAIGILNLPPLRERKGDINLLIDEFMSEINREFRGIHGEKWSDRKLSVNARKSLISHSWPGNIRELRNTLSRLVLWCPRTTIGQKEVSDALFAGFSANDEKNYFDPALLERSSFKLEDLLGEIAIEYIDRTLEKTGGNRRKAAAILGFANYQTMNNWIKKYRGAVRH
jgi:transcriptional regulator with PAS, ATPase and Fis domain